MYLIIGIDFDLSVGFLPVRSSAGSTMNRISNLGYCRCGLHSLSVILRIICMVRFETLCEFWHFRIPNSRVYYSRVLIPYWFGLLVCLFSSGAVQYGLNTPSIYKKELGSVRFDLYSLINVWCVVWGTSRILVFYNSTRRLIQWSTILGHLVVDHPTIQRIVNRGIYHDPTVEYPTDTHPPWNDPRNNSWVVHGWTYLWGTPRLATACVTWFTPRSEP